MKSLKKFRTGARYDFGAVPGCLVRRYETVQIKINAMKKKRKSHGTKQVRTTVGKSYRTAPFTIGVLGGQNFKGGDDGGIEKVRHQSKGTWYQSKEARHQP